MSTCILSAEAQKALSWNKDYVPGQYMDGVGVQKIRS